MCEAVERPALNGADLHSALVFVRQHISDFRRLLRPYGVACRAARKVNRPAILLRATQLAQFEREGGVLLHVEEAPEGRFRCELCT